MTAIRGKAAISFSRNTPLEIVDVDFQPPKAGEVRVQIKSTGLCHSDLYLLKGIDCGGNCKHKNEKLIPGIK